MHPWFGIPEGRLRTNQDAPQPPTGVPNLKGDALGPDA